MPLLPSIFLLLIPTWTFLTIDASHHQIPTSQVITIIQYFHPLTYPSVRTHKYSFVLDPQYVKHIRFYHGGLMSKIAFILAFNKNIEAITLGDSIFFASDTEIYDVPLVAHELVHTDQFHKYPILHYIRYNWFWLFKGYLQVPYEIEAYQFQNTVQDALHPPTN